MGIFGDKWRNTRDEGGRGTQRWVVYGINLLMK